MLYIFAERGRNISLYFFIIQAAGSLLAAFFHVFKSHISKLKPIRRKRDIANGEYKFMYCPQAKACGFLRNNGLNLKSVVNFNCVTACS